MRHPDLASLVDPAPLSVKDAIREAAHMVYVSGRQLHVRLLLESYGSFESIDELLAKEERRKVCQAAVDAWWRKSPFFWPELAFLPRFTRAVGRQ